MVGFGELALEIPKDRFVFGKPKFPAGWARIRRTKAIENVLLLKDQVLHAGEPAPDAYRFP
jgi:hypothetical protein